MKLNVALIAANGVTYPKPRIGMLTSPTYSDDGRITSALFEEEPVMNPVFRTARRADEEDVPAPLMAVEHYDLGVFVDWVWDCNQERQALRAKVKELEKGIDYLRASTGGNQSMGDPIPWEHVMYKELGQRHFQLTYSKDNPWGVPGKDYDESYKVVSAPLVRHQPAPSAFTEEK